MHTIIISETQLMFPKLHPAEQIKFLVGTGKFAVKNVQIAEWIFDLAQDYAYLAVDLDLNDEYESLNSFNYYFEKCVFVILSCLNFQYKDGLIFAHGHQKAISVALQILISKKLHQVTDLATYLFCTYTMQVIISNDTRRQMAIICDTIIEDRKSPTSCQLLSQMKADLQHLGKNLIEVL